VADWKNGTLRDLAGRLSDGRLDPKVLCSLPDDELVAELIAVPGIGPWTVQGALLLLGREDVVVPGDLRVRKAVRAAYRLDHLAAQQEVLAIADNWRPLPQPGDQLPVLGHLRAGQDTPGRPAYDLARTRSASSRRERACLISRLLAPGRMHAGQVGGSTAAGARRPVCR
jgi:hypothetical protein